MTGDDRRTCNGASDEAGRVTQAQPGIRAAIMQLIAGEWLELGSRRPAREVLERMHA